MNVRVESSAVANVVFATGRHHAYVQVFGFPQGGASLAPGSRSL